MSNSYCEKLLGALIDNQFNFENNLEMVIKKASQKVHVLTRITPSMYISKKKKLLVNV